MAAPSRRGGGGGAGLPNQGGAGLGAFVLGFATIGLVLALRRPGNPIGWLYGAAGLAWAYTIPVEPLIHQSIREHRPLPLAAQLVAATGDLSWAPAIALGSRYRPCCCPTATCARVAGGWSSSPA